MDFSNETTKNGLIQLLKQATTSQALTTSSYSLGDKTRDINLALDDFFMIANKQSGRWQLDDSTHTDQAIMYADIIEGQQDYSFDQDENGNQVYDIYKVRLLDENGEWHTLYQRDLQDGSDYLLDSTVRGIPTQYDLTGNVVLLSAIPDFDRDDALEIYYARSPKYFLTTDTTKRAGIPNRFHKYLVFKPAYWYWMARDQKKTAQFAAEVAKMEKEIKEYYSSRNRDERLVITTHEEPFI